MRMASGRSPRPQPNRKKAFFIGDAVPKPLGFTALSPEWLFCLGRLAPPHPRLRAYCIPAAGSALRSHPCVAVSSAQVRPV
jgi:hypothetical protein